MKLMAPIDAKAIVALLRLQREAQRQIEEMTGIRSAHLGMTTKEPT